MGFLVSSGSRVNNGQPPATSLRVQSSVNGLPLAFVHGQTRIAGNLIWYGNFASNSGSGKGGGKGGVVSSGGKGGSQQGTTYSASFMLGLCEGPIDQVTELWNNKTPQSLSGLGFTAFNGYQGQAPWGYLSSAGFGAYALNYTYLAYTAVANLSLGNSPELPNFNWEVRGSIANAVTEQTTVAFPYTYAASYFSLGDSVTEQVTIPSAPYQYQSQNYTASNAMPVVTGAINSSAILGSSSSGVVDLDGNPFTFVDTTPSATHEYSLGSAGLYEFYSGDAGLEVQIIDLAVSPGVRYIYNFSGAVTAGSNVIGSITTTSNIQAGQLVTGPGIAPGSVVISKTSSTVTLSAPALSNTSGTYTFWGAQLTQVLANSGFLPGEGTFTGTIPDVSHLNRLDFALFPAGMKVGQIVTGPSIPNNTTILEIDQGMFGSAWTAILSQNATGTTSFSTYSFGGGIQVYNLARGTYAVSVTGSAYGEYIFSSADNGATVGIIDVVDADPSQSLTDFLTNPRYGCGFPSAYLGDLSLLQDYAYSNNLFISPAIVQSQAANSYLKDFSTALNGEFVWSSGLLTFVPYGDVSSSANGKTYSPPAAAIYSLDDDDFLKNEGTASVGVSAFTSDDPVVCARTRQSDAYNDLKVEYLDRGNSYNPAIVESKDDASINLFGLRPADTKQLHLFCMEAAALQSAQLQLGRQLVRNKYTFTVPWYYILLDPMDVVEITDSNLGLFNQWVRILEISENQQDGTLTITAEEYLTGTGSTPQYGTQVKVGFTPNYNVDPGLPVAPVIFEAPVQIASNSGLEIWLATGGGTNFGGCDVWVSSDDQTYKWVARYQSGSRVGLLNSDFPSGSDPDTVDTLAVNLAVVGELMSATSQADADLGRTLCYVGGYAYPPLPQLSYVAGGSLPAMTYFVRGTYAFPGAEGPPSPEAVISVPAGNLLVVQDPPSQPNATAWNNYVGVNSGTEALQNSTPLAFGSPWTEPTSGLVTGTNPPPSETGYELVSYQTATFVSGSLYDLGTYIRRGQYGTTITDHPMGSQFARLDGTQVMFPYDKSQIGQTIYVKLLPFNLWGGAEYTLDEVQPFPHVIEGPPLPGVVKNFSVSQNNNVVAFYWTDQNDPSLKGFDLLYGPVGGNIGGATFITEAARGTESTTASVPPGSWTFYIRGHNIADQLGPVTTANFVVTNQNTLVATQVNAPEWITSEDIHFLRNHWGVLVPDSTVGASALTNEQLFTQFVPSPYPDTFWGAQLIDIGFNDTVRVWMSAQAFVRADAPAGSVPQNNFAIVAWKNGDPEPGSYSNWTTGYIDCEFIFGGYNQTNTSVPAYVTAFNVYVDKATVTENGSATVAPGGSAITFSPPFHDTPLINCTVIGSTSLSATAASPTSTGFTAHVFDPATGSDVGGTINFNAVGV